MSSTVPALTTTYTPSSTCTQDMYTNRVSNWYSIGGPLPTNCFPTGWASTSQYFSPGICPDGYTQACSSASTLGSYTETHATCCPSGYYCYTPTIFNFPGQACASVFQSQITTIVTDGSAYTVMLATLHTSTEAVNGYGVSIRYNQADLASISALTATTTSSSSSSSKSSSTPSQTAAMTTQSSSSTAPYSTSSTTATSTAVAGLTTAQKASIGAGVGVGVVAFIAVAGLILFFIRKRKANANAGGYLPPPQEVEISHAPIETWSGVPKKNIHEFYTPPSELSGERRSQDLTGPRI